jgi:hypothetical protein
MAFYADIQEPKMPKAVVSKRKKIPKSEIDSCLLPYPLPEPWRSQMQVLGGRVLDCVDEFGDRAEETLAARTLRDELIAEIKITYCTNDEL